VKLKFSVGGKVSYAASKAGASGGAAPTEAPKEGSGNGHKPEVKADKGGGGGLGSEFDVEVEQKGGGTTAGNWQPGVNGGLEKGKDSITLKGGVAFQHPIFGRGTFEFQPIEFHVIGFGEEGIQGPSVAAHGKITYPLKSIESHGYKLDLTPEVS